MFPLIRLFCLPVRRHRPQPPLPARILLRESFRRSGKVHNRTLSNLSHWPPEKIDALRQLLKGNYEGVPDLPSAFQITRSLPHEHPGAVGPDLDVLRGPPLPVGPVRLLAR